jgi:hypothetical protein
MDMRGCRRQMLIWAGLDGIAPMVNNTTINIWRLRIESQDGISWHIDPSVAYSDVGIGTFRSNHFP